MSLKRVYTFGKSSVNAFILQEPNGECLVIALNHSLCYCVVEEKRV